MKKLFIASCISISLAISSCSNFLDVAPTNMGDSNTSIQTAADAKVIMNGLMSKMANVGYYGRNFPLYADAKGGDFTIASQGRGYDYLYVFNHSASSNPYTDIWTQGFHSVVQINNLLTNIEKLVASGSTEDFASYKGQALTARALINFDLVRLYGKPYNMEKSSLGIPNVTKVLEYNAQEKRVSVEENYKQILLDLRDSESLLSKSKANGYINYFANKALQARVYLYMNDYENALKAAQEIIDSKVYALYSNADWVKSWTSMFGTESILELGVYPNEADAGTSSLGAMFRRKGHGSTAILGNFIAADPFLSKLKTDDTDVRWGIMAYDEVGTTHLGAVYKYSGSASLVGDKNTPSNSTAVNIKVIRLSEIYLIAAESALLKPTPDKSLAAIYLNAIRQRSPKLDAATSNTITLDMIADERSKELLGEGHRFFDMMRWNKSITFDDDLGNISTTNRPKTIDRTFFKTILPISLDEMNANPAIANQQNPSY
ncbi:MULTISPECIES: RagB/SusD family nutrient uptake outer membrane protein [unclassified Sphingobacterium]|uniref:RagB/SusD family nutrient uptake outer membrane protein n=1 Tax=unclassified Sphingobacterium TaxID=2609468 RepID=UPI0025CD37D3|nr:MULTISPECIES: RagB/SusD family nutrient uptake outer membrane protein [unclassified Sphingobacterium]